MRKETLANELEAATVWRDRIMYRSLTVSERDLIVSALRAPSPAALDPRTVEACAKIADRIAEQWEAERETALEITSRQIADEIRALLAQPAGSFTSTDTADFLSEPAWCGWCGGTCKCDDDDSVSSNDGAVK